MGLLRFIFILIGLAVCSELPTDDGAAFFRSYFSLFIMLALDYSRMAIKGKSRYEKVYGAVGIAFTALQGIFCLLGSFRQIVLDKSSGAYAIVSSETFRLVPSLYMGIDGYIGWTAFITLFIAGLEWTVPFVNRFTKRADDKKDEGDTAVEPKSGRLFRGEVVNKTNISVTQSVPETATGGGK